MKEDRLRGIAEEIRRAAAETLPVGTLSAEELEERVAAMLDERIGNGYLPIRDKVETVAGILSAIRGFGILDGLIADDSVTEIMVNGPDTVFIEVDGRVRRGEKSTRQIPLWMRGCRTDRASASFCLPSR
jgi:pilus assembly protein CpaF